MKKKQTYHRAHPTWCPGCGLFGVFDALKRAAANMGLAPEDVVVVTGIGCHGRMNNYFYSYGFHGLHGRAMPVATGIKLVNPKLTVIGVSGDGDAYSIGLGHFLHAVRRNVDITYIVVNNRLYSLTQGQMSPTTMFGMVTISTPFGSKDFPIEGPVLALAARGTFVARGFSAEAGHLAFLIEKGMRHKGFAFIDVLSPCVTYNKLNTFEWYKKNTFMIEKEPDYSPGDKSKAWEILNRDDRIAVGLLYEEEKPSYEELILPDTDQPIAFVDLSVRRKELEIIMENFR